MFMKLYDKKLCYAPWVREAIREWSFLWVRLPAQSSFHCRSQQVLWEWLSGWESPCLAFKNMLRKAVPCLHPEVHTLSIRAFFAALDKNITLFTWSIGWVSSFPKTWQESCALALQYQHPSGFWGIAGTARAGWCLGWMQCTELRDIIPHNDPRHRPCQEASREPPAGSCLALKKASKDSSCLDGGDRQAFTLPAHGSKAPRQDCQC